MNVLERVSQLEAFSGENRSEVISLQSDMALLFDITNELEDADRRGREAAFRRFWDLQKEVRRMRKVVVVLLIAWALLLVGLTTAAVVEKIKANRIITVSIAPAPETPTPPVDPPAPGPGPSQPGENREGPCPNKQDCGKA